MENKKKKECEVLAFDIGDFFESKTEEEREQIKKSIQQTIKESTEEHSATIEKARFKHREGKFIIETAIRGKWYMISIENKFENKEKSLDLIEKIIEIAGVKEWDKVEGKQIRARKSYFDSIDIGHLYDDKWLTLKR